MNFSDMLKAPVLVATQEKKPRKYSNVGPSLVRSRAEARYRLYLENNKLTTGQIAAKLGLSHMGCLCSLYDMEKRGVVERVGTIPKANGKGRASILWTWVKEKQ